MVAHLVLGEHIVSFRISSIRVDSVEAQYPLPVVRLQGWIWSKVVEAVVTRLRHGSRLGPGSNPHFHLISGYGLRGIAPVADLRQEQLSFMLIEMRVVAHSVVGDSSLAAVNQSSVVPLIG